MARSIKSLAGDRFEVILNFPVGQVEYARKSTSTQYGRDRFGRTENFVELSDACSVTSQDGNTVKYFDFLVCACPLGVLKESVQSQGQKQRNDILTFQPPLPFSKVDAISSVGFGLLDKLYLTFPDAFWRQEGIFKENDHCLFGNISGVNPHHYMFFDIGRCLGSGENALPILMSLVSGREAVACERLSDDELLAEVMATLRAIFSKDMVPEPKSFRFTRWGQDKYSRGSYTFLPPGTTEQDFHLLQSPINGNGDSLLLDGSEIMRLFFAGEHTTALHPSMAHGAMLSGIRAAKEVVSTVQFMFDEDKDIDRIIPVALFRHNNPGTELKCSLCNKVGGRIREGSLIAFKRGARQVLVHNNCAEYSPEVEVIDSKWKHVIKAVNRGKLFNCAVCGESGATIGCQSANCFRVYHFSCSEDAGWRFDRDGKIFFCDLHRREAEDYTPHCDRISMKVHLASFPGAALFCRLCKSPENHEGLGQLLAFQYDRRQACVHEECIKYTTICDTAEDEDSRMGHEYKNVFEAIDTSRKCTACELPGATARCATADCEKVFHILCAGKGGWNFETKGKRFRCDQHRKRRPDMNFNNRGTNMDATSDGITSSQNRKSEVATCFNHTLLAQLGAVPLYPSGRIGTPGNLDIGFPSVMSKNGESALAEESEEEESDDESDADMEALGTEGAMDVPLSSKCKGASQSIHVQRKSPTVPWGLTLWVVQIGCNHMLAMPTDETSASPLGDYYKVIVSIDAKPVGEGNLSNLRSIVKTCLQGSTELTLGVIVRAKPHRSKKL
jgi:Flavin containing amine oxidoreductase/PHD-like zinc-binding domain